MAGCWFKHSTELTGSIFFLQMSDDWLAKMGFAAQRHLIRHRQLEKFH
jgi:hypothetical protein